jgi:hypothetical protein
MEDGKLQEDMQLRRLNMRGFALGAESERCACAAGSNELGDHLHISQVSRVSKLAKESGLRVIRTSTKSAIALRIGLQTRRGLASFHCLSR